MKALAALLGALLLSACVSTAIGVAGTAVGVAGAAVGVAVKTTGAVAGAAVSAVTPHHRDRNDRRDAPQE